MFKIHKLIFIPLLVLLSGLLIIPLYAENQQKLDITWTWVDGKNLYQGRPISFSVIITKTNPNLSIKVTSIWLHTSWMEPNVFTFDNFDFELKTGENRFNFTRAIPSTAVLEETNDFACIIKYKTSDGTEFDSSLIRAPSVTIKQGQTIYSEQTINPSVVGNVGFFFFVSLGCVYLFRKNLKTFLNNKTKYIPVILFVSVFFVYLLSVHWNFIGYLVSEPAQQGFLLTGDEPHYIFVIKGMSIRNFDVRVIYPENFVTYSKNSTGIFTFGNLVPVHYAGLPILSLIPYVIGKWIIGSGVCGVLVLNCLIGSGIILLIYKISVLLSSNLVASLTVALTFAFSTLLFPWVGQVFPEIMIAFSILFVSYKVLTVKKKYDWLIVCIVLGLLPFLKTHMFVLGVLSMFLIVVKQIKSKEWKNLRYSLLGYFIGMSLFVFFVIGIYGIASVPSSSTISIPAVSLAPTINILGNDVSIFPYLGLIGLWMDSNSGLLFYSPILILAFLGMPSFLKNKNKFFVIFIMSIFFVWYFGVGFRADWHGWLSIPSRYMICILPLLSIPFIFALKEFGKNILFKISFVILFLFGLISSGSIAFNRVLGLVVVWVNGVGRSRYVLTMGKAFGVDISSLPDFAYAWYKGGDIGNVPQSSILLAGWAVGFLIIAMLLLCIGYKGDNLNITEKIKQVVGKYHEKNS